MLSCTLFSLFSSVTIFTKTIVLYIWQIFKSIQEYLFCQFFLIWIMNGLSCCPNFLHIALLEDAHLLSLFSPSCGSAAQRRPWPPHSWGFCITHDTSQSVWLLWTSDQLVAETSNWQHSQQTNIHALGGIRTRNLSRRTATDLHLKPRGYWDQHAHTG